MSKGRPARTLLAAALAAAVLVPAITGCAGGTLRLMPSTADVEAPWRLPADAYPTQRLFRMRYQGPEGEASFRLTLYLEAPQRYRMEASDTLGRKVWSLGLLPSGEALWLDHRNELYCLVSGTGEQSFLPLTHLPLEALPRLLLGLVPVPPAADRRSADVRRAETGELSFHDEQGRLWSGDLDAGHLAWWSVTEAPGAAPVAWWKRVEGEAIFSDRRGAQQVRWTEQVRESLTDPLERLEVPGGFREGVCVDA